MGVGDRSRGWPGGIAPGALGWALAGAPRLGRRPGRGARDGVAERPALAAPGGGSAGWRGVAWLAAIVLMITGCASPPPPVMISYASTPAPVATRGEPTSAPPGSRRPAARAKREASPTGAPEGQASGRGGGPPETSDPGLARPSPIPSRALPASAQPDAVGVVDPTVTLPGIGGLGAAPSGTPAPPVPGEVSEEEGAFVTSSSHDAQYYYARADTGWHRIRADHRIWFATAADLLKVFPGRELHGGITPTPPDQPTPGWPPGS